MKIKKLSRMPYANAHVEIDSKGTIHLISYNTRVLSLHTNGWLICTGLYSPTTRKHIGAFMREYVKYPNGETGSYHEVKRMWKNGWDYNIITGEVVDTVV